MPYTSLKVATGLMLDNFASAAAETHIHAHHIVCTSVLTAVYYQARLLKYTGSSDDKCNKQPHNTFPLSMMNQYHSEARKCPLFSNTKLGY